MAKIKIEGSVRMLLRGGQLPLNLFETINLFMLAPL